MSSILQPILVLGEVIQRIRPPLTHELDPRHQRLLTPSQSLEHAFCLPSLFPDPWDPPLITQTGWGYSSAAEEERTQVPFAQLFSPVALIVFFFP